MFSLHAYSAVVPSSTSITYSAVAPVADPVLFSSGNIFFVGILQNLLGAYLLSPTGDKSKIFTPSVLSISPHQITPIDQTANTLPQNNPPRIFNLATPKKLLPNEGMELDSSNTSSSATTRAVGLVWLSDGAVTPATGEIVTVRATITSSATGFTWQNASMTLDNTLAAGTYNIVGARLEGTHAIAFRFVFQGSSAVRPGGLAVTSSTQIESYEQRNGRLGVWGTFTNFTIPTVDIMSNGSSDSCILYIDLIKTG